MARTICPAWLGYFLINPFRKLLENPDKILGQFVREGMIVLEPGCGMGFFTLPLARMVGPKGRVVVVEVQQKMLSVLSRRAEKAGLLDRIELRHITAEGLGVEDLSGEVDFVAAIHMVHEVPNQTALFTQVWEVLKHGCKLLVIEPKGHVTSEQFEQTVGYAKKVGFTSEVLPIKIGGRAALLTKS